MYKSKLLYEAALVYPPNKQKDSIMRDMELAKAVSYIVDVLEWDEDYERMLQDDIRTMTGVADCPRDLYDELHLDYATGSFSCVTYHRDFAVKFFVSDYHRGDDGCARYIEDIIYERIEPSEYQPMILDAFRVRGMMVVIMPCYNVIDYGEGELCDDSDEYYQYYQYETLVASWYDEDEDWRGSADVHNENLMWCQHTQHEIITDPFSWA